MRDVTITLFVADVCYVGASDSSGSENPTPGGLASLDALGLSVLEQSRSGCGTTTNWLTRHQQAYDTLRCF